MLKKILKELFKHSLIYSAGFILTSLLSVVLLPFYTRFLTPSDYGILSLSDLFKSIVLMIALCGIGAGFNRYYYHYNNKENRLKLYNTALVFCFTSGLILCILLFTLSNTISYLLLGSSRYSLFIKLIALSLFFSSIKNLNINFFATSKQSIVRTIYTTGAVYLTAFITIFFLIYFRYGVISFFYSDVIISFLLFIVTCLHLSRNINIFKFDFNMLKQMLIYGIPIVPALLFASIMHNIDQYLLRLFKGLQIVGIYSIAYNFPFMLNTLLLSSLGLIWNNALIFEIFKDKESDYIYSRITTYFMLVYIYAMFCLSVMSPLVVKLLVAPEYYIAYRYIPIICLGLIPYALHSFLSVGVKVNNKTWYLVLTFLIGSIVNLICNYFLIPKYSAMGASVATLIAYTIFGLVSYYFYSKIYTIHFEWIRLFKLLILAILLYCIVIYSSVHNIYYEVILRLSFCVLYIIFLYIIGFFTDNEKRLIYIKIRSLFKTSN